MTDPIDYSRPVGWWCPVCTRCAQLDRADDLIKLGLLNCCPSLPVIPRYFPIPEGQRPPAASEVEKAEVVTAQDFGSNLGAGYCVMADISAHIAEPFNGGAEFFWAREFYWPTTGATPTEHINRIAQASARARIVTGATE